MDEAYTASQLLLKIQFSLRQPFTNTNTNKWEQMHLNRGKNSHHSWDCATPKYYRSKTLQFCSPGKKMSIHRQTPSLYSLLLSPTALILCAVPGTVSSWGVFENKPVNSLQEKPRGMVGYPGRYGFSCIPPHCLYPAESSSITPGKTAPSTTAKSSQAIFQDICCSPPCYKTTW